MAQTTKIVAICLILFVVITGCTSDEEKKITHFKKGKAYLEKGEYRSSEL